MSKGIMVVGDDGSVFHVDGSDLARIAKKVPPEHLSADVKAHVKANKPAANTAHFFATTKNFFAASKSDIKSTPADAMAANTTNFFATNSKFFVAKSGKKG